MRTPPARCSATSRRSAATVRHIDHRRHRRGRARHVRPDPTFVPSDRGAPHVRQIPPARRRRGADRRRARRAAARPARRRSTGRHRLGPRRAPLARHEAGRRHPLEPLGRHRALQAVERRLRRGLAVHQAAGRHVRDRDGACRRSRRQHAGGQGVRDRRRGQGLDRGRPAGSTRTSRRTSTPTTSPPPRRASPACAC